MIAICVDDARTNKTNIKLIKAHRPEGQLQILIAISEWLIE